MFNKRENNESETSNRGGAGPAATGNPTPAPTQRTGGAAGAATIGPSISIDGQLKGEEDLIVEGRIKGTIELKKNTLTIGAKGTLDAQVFAHTIFVEGTVNGDLYASERISILKSARITGNILAPRISLEDGAKFRGSIDMDADSEDFRKAFGKSSSSTASHTSDKDKAKPQGSSPEARPMDRSSQATPPGSKTGTSAA